MNKKLKRTRKKGKGKGNKRAVTKKFKRTAKGIYTFERQKKALDKITLQVKKIKEKKKKEELKKLKKPTSADRERLNNAIREANNAVREAHEAKQEKEENRRRMEEIKNDPNLNKRQKARMMLQLRA
tara:strand:- start:4317 stop:4697 length:381 start_codon:yes stop_codon:yes gene_type:complete